MYNSCCSVNCSKRNRVLTPTCWCALFRYSSICNYHRTLLTLILHFVNTDLYVNLNDIKMTLIGGRTFERSIADRSSAGDR